MFELPYLKDAQKRIKSHYIISKQILLGRGGNYNAER